MRSIRSGRLKSAPAAATLVECRLYAQCRRCSCPFCEKLLHDYKQLLDGTVRERLLALQPATDSITEPLWQNPAQASAANTKVGKRDVENITNSVF